MGLYDERDELVPGRRLGRYEIVAAIGEGGMGRVFAARMEGTRGFRKIVALKTLSAAVAADPEAERMLLNEAQLASQIHHRNVVEVLDLGEDSGTLFIVMEWVDGESLQRLLRVEGRPAALPFAIAARVAADAASGLHAAHELRDETGHHLAIVHRDVSPQNILVAHDGTVKVVDFGIAKALGVASQATRTGELKGKISYMSAEQVNGAPVDRRSDIYALGVCLFEMITATRPFVGPHEVAVLQAIAVGHAPSPSTIVPGCPYELEQIVMTALARDPNYRFPTAEAFSLALEGFLSRTGLVVTAAHLAGVVRERCGARMDAARKRITQGAGAAGPAPAASMPSTPGLPGRPSEVPLHTPSANISTLATPALVTAPALAPRSGALPWAVGVVALLLAVGTTVILVRARGSSPDGAAPGSRSAAIALHVTPQAARVVVGGALAGAGDQSVARPAEGARAHVVVSADGYATSTLDLAADAPENVQIDLVAVTSPTAGASPSSSATAAEAKSEAPEKPAASRPASETRRRPPPAAPPPRPPPPLDPPAAGPTVPKNPY